MGPVLFLDIDGVLNSATWMRTRGPGLRSGCHPDMLDPAACARLHRVLVATGADVVLSSAWRYSTKRADVENAPGGLRDLTDWLDAKGCGVRFVGVTPCWHDLPKTGRDDGALVVIGYCRGVEIQAWLDANPDRERFAIVDDSDDMAHLRAWLIRTDHEHGLLDADADRLIRALNREALSPPTAAPTTLDTDKMPGED